MNSSSGIWRGLHERELGLVSPLQHAATIRRKRARSMELSKHKDIVTSNRSAINSLQVDPVEARYVLVGASNASAAVYDIIQPTNVEGISEKHEALFSVGKETSGSHQYSVSSVHWYPVDTGIFVTGSFDETVKVWDANTVEMLLQFDMSAKVHALSMSPVATTHMLIATGTDDYRVRLCDIGSGAFTHTLSGHRDGVWAVKWSASSEWIVITGGCEGAIRLWDIRRAGCFFVLDQHKSQISQHIPAPESRQDAISSNSNARNGLPLHPGLASVLDRATAHYGAVTALETTPDGHYLLSAGSDSRVRLWDIETGCNTLVNYEATRINGNKKIELAVSSDGSLVFIPCSSSIQVYDMLTGGLYATFKGHYDLVNCCIYHSQSQELYSGSSDRRILVWAPNVLAPIEEEKTLASTTMATSLLNRKAIVHADEDDWSD